MGTIASLSVSLTARVSKFEKGFKRASKIAKRFGRDIARHTKTMATFGLVVGAVAVGAVASLIKNQFQAIDSTAKLADVLGFTTEQLSSYQFGAQLAGIEQEKFNSSMIRFSKSIADAQDGLSTPIRALERLGLQFSDLQNLTKHDQLLLIADKFAQLGNQVDRDAVLLNLFGRNGAAMGKFLEKGAAGIEAMLAEAEKLGIAFSRVDAAQVEAANDAMTRMKAIIAGAAQVATIQLSPIITTIIDELITMAAEGGGVGRVIFNAFKNIIRSVAELADWFSLLKAGWYGFQGVVLLSAALILHPLNALGETIAAIINLIPGMEVEFNSVTKALEDGFINGASEAFFKAGRSYDDFINKVNGNKVNLIFEEIEKKAAMVAKNHNDDSSKGNIGEFAQGDFSRMVNFNPEINSKNNGATESQAGSIIELLEKIEQKIGKAASTGVTA